MNETTPDNTKPPPGGKRWPALIIGLLTANAIFCAVTLHIAINDPSFAVEPDAYQKGLAWDEHVAAKQASDALGWSVQLAVGEPDASGDRPVTVTLTDREGAPLDGLTVEAIAFHQARAANRLPLAFERAAPGEYRATAPLRRDGWWRIELNAQRGGDRFIAETQKYVGAFRPRFTP